MNKILSIMISVAVIAVFAGVAASAELTHGPDLVNKIDQQQENIVEQKESPQDGKKKDRAKKSYKKKGKEKAGAASLNINTANKEELEALPGIDTAKAQAIVDGRPYNKKEGIMKVKGIKKRLFNKIKDKITI